MGGLLFVALGYWNRLLLVSGRMQSSIVGYVGGMVGLIHLFLCLYNDDEVLPVSMLSFTNGTVKQVFFWFSLLACLLETLTLCVKRQIECYLYIYIYLFIHYFIYFFVCLFGY